MKQILISGYYGFGNSGDDALLLSIIKDFERKGLKDRVVVLSYRPEETEREYGVKAVSRMNPFAVFLSILKARLFISGGGTLIQDGTSTKSLLYYLSLIRLAKLFGKKVMLYANGIGPVRKKSNRRLCKKVLNRVDAITVRDKKSLSELEALGITVPEIRLTADPVFLLEKDESVDELLQKHGLDNDIFCIAVRSPKSGSGEFAEKLAFAADRLSEKYGMRAVLLPLQSIDGDISDEICRKMHSGGIVIRERLSPGQILSFVSRCRMCIGMRLHMLIYAAAMGVPIVGIVYDPKVSGFMEYAEQELYIDLEALTEDKLFELADRCMSEREALSASLAEVRKKLCAFAEENMNTAVRLYSEVEVE
ncbi:MAG: polysaccharide pyruvyl transferase CsaB [Clostridia bacterium]|nr:polysaccharide pyruvyl transferase CsaB [Clostridia bacterium]